MSNSDARFRNKVVLIEITGSWCPNCHDEAPFLAALYNKYRGQGLEVVALSFEEAEQLANPTRLRAFIKEYGIKYTVLLGGETSSAKEKLTQARDWDTWPATFFVGRDGLVKRGALRVLQSIPAATGELFVKAKDDFVGGSESTCSSGGPKLFTIGGWFFPAQSPAAGRKRSRPQPNQKRSSGQQGRIRAGYLVAKGEKTR